MISRLIQAVRRNPWSSVQDGLLIAAVMLVASLLALEYNLFFFIAELSEPQRKISLAEAIFLTILLALCLVAFVLRRLREERRELARNVASRDQLRKLRILASEDPLTSLANRRVFESALAAAISRLSDGVRHALFLIDLDHFKHVNDQYGHLIGDRVLQLVAERLRSATRPNDLLARLGGDEFAVLSYNVGREAALDIGQRFLKMTDGEVVIADHHFSIGVSIGAALIPENGTTAEEVLQNADVAMYAAKRQSKPQVMLFDAGVGVLKRLQA